MFGVEPSEFMDDRNEDGVAALLRRRREELGRDIPTVARQLRIRAVYISAIEDGRLQDLPGTAYAVGFVRAYADYLGLDGNSVVGDYRDELARRSRQNQLIWPVDQVEHKHFPGGIVLIVCVLLAGAIYGGWYFASQPGGTGIDLIDQVPEFMKKQTSGEESEAPAPAAEGQSGAQVPASDTGSTPTSAQASQPAQTEPAPAEPAQAASTTAPAAADVTAPAASTAVPAEEPAAAAEPTPPGDEADVPVVGEPAVPAASTAAPAATSDAQPAAAAEAAPATAPAQAVPVQAAPVQAAPVQTAAVPAAPAVEVPVVEEQPAAAPAATASKRIVLRATKDSWVEIFDAKEEVVLQRILRAGETFSVPVQDGLTMNTGNAGGVVIEVDGKARPALGSVGVVKRGVKLDPASLGVQ
jgi:cytoskeleton protein RodZ